jgi:hypothetical protein
VLLTGLGTLLMAACADELPLEPDAKSLPPKASPPGIITLAAPANDDFANASVVGTLPFSDTISTVEATPEPTDPEDCVGTGPTVWYRYTASASGRLSANTFGSDYDTGLSVYTGTQGNLSQVACNDDADGLQSRVMFQVDAGETYYFMVAAYGSGPGGILAFMVEEAPPALEVALTIDERGSVDANTGTVTVRGTVTCSREAFVDLSGTIRQRAGRLLLTAQFDSFVPCEGTTPWEAQAVATTGLFAGGPAELTATAFFFDPTIGDGSSLEQSVTIRLRGRGKAK